MKIVLEAECKHYRDRGDPTGISCKKAQQLKDSNRDTALKQLKAWALRGRACNSRAEKSCGGRWVEPKIILVLDDHVLDALREGAERAPLWFCEAIPDVLQPKPAAAPAASARASINTSCSTCKTSCSQTRFKFKQFRVQQF